MPDADDLGDDLVATRTVRKHPLEDVLGVLVADLDASQRLCVGNVRLRVDVQLRQRVGRGRELALHVTGVRDYPAMRNACAKRGERHLVHAAMTERHDHNFDGARAVVARTERRVEVVRVVAEWRDLGVGWRLHDHEGLLALAEAAGGDVLRGDAVHEVERLAVLEHWVGLADDAQPVARVVADDRLAILDLGELRRCASDLLHEVHWHLADGEIDPAHLGGFRRCHWVIDELAQLHPRNLAGREHLVCAVVPSGSAGSDELRGNHLDLSFVSFVSACTVDCSTAT